MWKVIRFGRIEIDGGSCLKLNPLVKDARIKKICEYDLLFLSDGHGLCYYNQRCGSWETISNFNLFRNLQYISKLPVLLFSIFNDTVFFFFLSEKVLKINLIH